MERGDVRMKDEVEMGRDAAGQELELRD